MLHTVKCGWPFQPEMLGIWCEEGAMTQPTAVRSGHSPGELIGTQQLFTTGTTIM
jgi:hypothetical protein